jgi:hypothetical protein
MALAEDEGRGSNDIAYALDALPTPKLAPATGFDRAPPDQTQ